MSLWNLPELSLALKASIIQSNLIDQDLEIDQLIIDSRKHTDCGVFVALKGENNDGHKYICQAIENGARILIIDNSSYLDLLKSENYFLVKDSYEALKALAKFSRQRSKAKIIAVTGSAGKTSVKEMLKLVFSSQGKTFASKGNYNNHIGLPLCLANFSSNNDFGIFEIGMNHANEIEPLSKILQPDLAIITNIYPVHIENFKNETGIALAKSEIFSGVVPGGYALINQDSKHFVTLKSEAQKIGLSNILTFGTDKLSDFRIVDSKLGAKSVISVKVKESGSVIEYNLLTQQESLVKNSIICFAALNIFNCDVALGLESLMKMSAIEGRGNLIKAYLGNKEVTIIDDSYNANSFSMINGINYTISLKKDYNRIILALGDMLELGDKSLELHQKVLKYLEGKSFDQIILVGKEMDKAAKSLNLSSYKSFPDSIIARDYILDNINDNDLLYVKGSRGIRMERIFQD